MVITHPIHRLHLMVRMMKKLQGMMGLRVLVYLVGNMGVIKLELYQNLLLEDDRVNHHLPGGQRIKKHRRMLLQPSWLALRHLLKVKSNRLLLCDALSKVPGSEHGVKQMAILEFGVGRESRFLVPLLDI